MWDTFSRKRNIRSDLSDTLPEVRRNEHGPSNFLFRFGRFPPALLLVVSAAYGFIRGSGRNPVGDWAMMWIPVFLGKEGLIKYFAASRPLWGLFYISEYILDRFKHFRMAGFLR